MYDAAMPYIPRWSSNAPHAGPEGALIYVKVGHLGATFMPLPAEAASR